MTIGYTIFRHKFICNYNGQWVGQWPVCLPKIACPKEEISIVDSSVFVEKVGNAYFLNESLWFAINDTYMKYHCAHENAIMVGNNIRLCGKSGKWNSKAPYCTRTGELQLIDMCACSFGTLCIGLSGLSIAGILFVVLIVFVGIVLVVFRMYSKNVKRELRETRNELSESARKRFSEEFYADIKEDHYYDNTEVGHKSCYEDINYEIVGEPPRYEMGPPSGSRQQPEYLDMLATK